jgi:hypothetical protein
MIMGYARPGNKNDCADEGRQEVSALLNFLAPMYPSQYKIKILTCCCPPNVNITIPIDHGKAPAQLLPSDHMEVLVYILTLYLLQFPTAYPLKDVPLPERQTCTA